MKPEPEHCEIYYKGCDLLETDFKNNYNAYCWQVLALMNTTCSVYFRFCSFPLLFFPFQTQQNRRDSARDSVILKKKVTKSRGNATITNRSPSQTLRGRGNRQIQTSTNRTNVQKALRSALSSPSEVIAMIKGLKNTRTK